MTSGFIKPSQEDMDALADQLLNEGVPTIDNYRELLDCSAAAKVQEKIMLAMDMAASEGAAILRVHVDEQGKIIIDSMSMWEAFDPDLLKSLEPTQADWDYLELDRKAYKPVPLPQKVRASTINPKRPVGRPMRSVNRNR